VDTVVSEKNKGQEYGYSGANTVETVEEENQGPRPPKR